MLRNCNEFHDSSLFYRIDNKYEYTIFVDGAFKTNEYMRKLYKFLNMDYKENYKIKLIQRNNLKDLINIIIKLKNNELLHYFENYIQIKEYHRYINHFNNDVYYGEIFIEKVEIDIINPKYLKIYKELNTNINEIKRHKRNELNLNYSCNYGYLEGLDNKISILVNELEKIKNSEDFLISNINSIKNYKITQNKIRIR